MVRLVSALVVILLLLAVLGCERPGDDLERFVRDYVASVYERSAFHQAYTADDEAALLKVSRQNMTGAFEIVGWDRVGPGAFEFAIEFSNGARGVVATQQEQGRVVSAGLIVTPP